MISNNKLLPNRLKVATGCFDIKAFVLTLGEEKKREQQKAG